MHTIIKRAVLALCCTASLCITSCKKNDTATPSSAQISLLTNGTWKISKLEFQNSNGSWTTIAIPSAQANETFSFNRDNTYFGSYTGSSGNGNWKFSADYTQLYLVNPGNSYSPTLMINTLNETTLQFTLPGTIAVYGISYYAERDTFTH